MAEGQIISEERMQEAVLGGLRCRALAYVEVTRVDVPGGERGRTHTIDGVRTWRGSAIVDVTALPARWHLDKALRYDGPLVDGEQERWISDEVYIYQTRCTRPARSPDRDAEAGSDRIHISFIGASNRLL